MATPIEIRVPDIGGFSDVGVIDVLVQVGQTIDKEMPLITLETEKAAMDVPAPVAGRITQMLLKRGDKVSQGAPILMLEPAAAPRAADAPSTAAKPQAPAPKAATPGVAAAPIAAID